MTPTDPDASPMVPLLLTADEAATRTGLTAGFLKDRAGKGLIPCVRGPRRAYLFSQADIEEALRILRQPVTTQPEPRLTSSRAKRRRAA